MLFVFTLTKLNIDLFQFISDTFSTIMQQISTHESKITDFVNDSRILYRISLSTVRKLINYDVTQNYEAEVSIFKTCFYCLYYRYQKTCN